MTAIELDGLTKEYGPVTALDGVDLEVEEGEIFGFLGPNGAGKSTTIDILLDFSRPTDGSARVFGLDAQGDSLAVRKRTGVLPEGYHVYDRLTGRQHLEFVVDSKGVNEDPGQLAARVGIEDAIDRKAGGYSKGMKQRLTLAMALVGDPDLLILDEPSTGLDPSGAREIREIIREESDRGTTVFFSSHVLSQVEAVCDRVGILRAGKLIAVDTVSGLREAAGTKTQLRVTAAELPESAVDAVRALDDVTSATVEGTELVVSVGDGSKTRVLDALESAGVTVTDFSTEESSLEDIFISYTEGDR
ncbi:ABC transporter ATP-binding protein [Halovenus marina]|uniref:ABC transporter ATP-binding protein n=1 Tax=Halovenus marina TaxID=3396621 RepID=UPI003F57E8FE